MTRKAGTGNGRRALFYAWWYVSIGLGFVLLGFRSLISGQRMWQVTLRWVIAAGFIALGALTFRSAGKLR